MSRGALLTADECVLVLVDMQTSLGPHLMGLEEVVRTQSKMIRAAFSLGVPVIVTEHNPDKLGRTLPELEAVLAESPGLVTRINKMSFSAFGEPTYRAALESFGTKGRRTVLLLGCETHICVCQTALEMTVAGWPTHLIVDGVTARHPIGHETGLDKLRRRGIEFDTWEMAAYQWVREAGTDAFRSLLKLVKDHG